MSERKNDDMLFMIFIVLTTGFTAVVISLADLSRTLNQIAERLTQ